MDTCLPDGYRYPGGGAFISLGLEAVCWSSMVGGSSAWFRALNTAYTSVHRRALSRSYGLSVRCVRNLRREKA